MHLRTEVDAILRCDKCQARTVVIVPLEISPNGAVRGKLSEILLEDGWVEARTHDQRRVHLCPGCARPKLERIYG